MPCLVAVAPWAGRQGTQATTEWNKRVNETARCSVVPEDAPVRLARDIEAAVWTKRNADGTQ